MECDGQIVEDVLSHGLIVVSHIEQQSFLVCNVEVVLDLVIKFDIDVGRHLCARSALVLTFIGNRSFVTGDGLLLLFLLTVRS